MLCFQGNEKAYMWLRILIRLRRRCQMPLSEAITAVGTGGALLLCLKDDKRGLSQCK